jgi:hypothetical protein
MAMEEWPGFAMDDLKLSMIELAPSEPGCAVEIKSQLVTLRSLPDTSVHHRTQIFHC